MVLIRYIYMKLLEIGPFTHSPSLLSLSLWSLILDGASARVPVLWVWLQQWSNYYTIMTVTEENKKGNRRGERRGDWEEEKQFFSSGLSEIPLLAIVIQWKIDLPGANVFSNTCNSSTVVMLICVRSKPASRWDSRLSFPIFSFFKRKLLWPLHVLWSLRQHVLARVCRLCPNIQCLVVESP